VVTSLKNKQNRDIYKVHFYGKTMEINVDIRSTGMESAAFSAPFDKALEALTDKGYDVISLPQNALLRIKQGKDSFISRNGNWTREGVIWFPNGNPKLVRNSPILYSAKEATEANRQGKKFYPTKEQIEQALADSVDFPTENISIPTNRFGENEITAYAFRDVAEQHGQFLREVGIKEMPVWAVHKNHVKKQNSPFSRQLWFGGLDYRSVLGSDGHLDGNGGLRGVKVGAEGTHHENK
jgi:hypothetical protein